uniref:Uncharacterized protein n=1 Tax=Romanomermis culicivorax TaxID=13658 RepID=A0A915L2S8_ROMCU
MELMSKELMPNWTAKEDLRLCELCLEHCNILDSVLRNPETAKKNELQWKSIAKNAHEWLICHSNNTHIIPKLEVEFHMEICSREGRETENKNRFPSMTSKILGNE